MIRRYILNSNRIYFISVLSICSVVLFGCASQTKSVDDTIVEEQEFSPTVTSTNSVVLTSTPNDNQSEILSITSPTPVFDVNDPNRSYESIPDQFELPEWMSDLNNQIAALLTNVNSSTNRLSFINANTGEIHSIELMNGLANWYFWSPDGTEFGLLSTNDRVLFLINLATGKVRDIEIQDYVVDCLPSFNSDWPFLSPMGNRKLELTDKLFFCPQESSSTISSIINENGLSYVELITPTGIEQLKVPYDENETQVIDHLLSPDQKLLAILFGEVPDGNDYSPVGGQSIIFDVSDGTQLHTLEGNFCLSSWSPDSKQLLILESEWYACTGRLIPCVINAETGVRRCFEAIHEGHDVASVGLFEWSKDSSSLYYIYDDQSNNSKRSDFCIVDLETERIHCPTESLNVLYEQNVELYKESSDGNFVAIAYGDSCIGCDFWGDPTGIVMNMEGEILYYFGEEIFEYSLGLHPYPYYSLIWRP